MEAENHIKMKMLGIVFKKYAVYDNYTNFIYKIDQRFRNKDFEDQGKKHRHSGNYGEHPDSYRD